MTFRMVSCPPRLRQSRVLAALVGEHLSHASSTDPGQKLPAIARARRSRRGNENTHCRQPPRTREMNAWWGRGATAVPLAHPLADPPTCGPRDRSDAVTSHERVRRWQNQAKNLTRISL